MARTTRLRRLQADVSGVTKQFSKELRESVVPGYSGGTTENPSYDEICVGNTGHAESPTTPNRQGNDVGTQYHRQFFFIIKNRKKLLRN
jgi:peptide methionine sulfoxide reductase MsrA